MPAAHVIIGLSKTFSPFVGLAPIADGVDQARLIGLKSVIGAQMMFGTTSGVSPGPGYPWLFIRDYVYMAEPYPGFFTAAYMRPVLDLFVSTIGGEVGFENFPAEHIDTNGTVFYRGGVGNIGQYPSFDNAPFLVLLAALCYERGDTSVYNTYKAEMLQVLAAAPVDGSGRIYSDPFNYSVGWGFEDLQTSGNKGGLGMATAYHALAYQRLGDMAMAEGDSATMLTARAAEDSFVEALRTLRRGDNYYNGCTDEPNKHVMLTAMVVYYGLATVNERIRSAQALLADYNAVSAFSGGVGSTGGNLAQRGGVRHLVYPAYFSVGSQPDVYQNGTAWLGPWTGWLGYALSAVDVAKGRELLEAAASEVTREHRVDGFAPWEWSIGDTRGSLSYCAALGFAATVSDAQSMLTVPVGIFGGTNTEAYWNMPYGSNATRYRLTSDTSDTLTLTLSAAAETNSTTDPIPITSPTYGAEGPLTTISLTGGWSEIVSGVGAGYNILGGRVKVALTAGTSPGIVTLDALPSAGPPTMVSALLDDYGTDKLATDYFVTGADWSVGGEVLTNTGNTAQAALWKTEGTVEDGDFIVRCKSVDGTTRYAGLFIRGSSDANDGVFVVAGSGAFNVYDLVGGVGTLIGGSAVVPPLVSDTYFWMRVRVVGTAVSVYINEVLYANCTTTIVAPGYFGPYVAGGGTELISFSDLYYIPSANLNPLVPPGYAVTYQDVCYLPGDVVLNATGRPLQLRDPLGYSIGYEDVALKSFSFDSLAYKTARPTTAGMVTVAQSGDVTASGCYDVSLSSETSGATVRYTTDGSPPDGNSTLYTGQFTVASTTTIRAIAQSAGNRDSDETSFTVTITDPASWYDTFLGDDGDALDALKWGDYFGTPAVIDDRRARQGGPGSGSPFTYEPYVFYSVETWTANTPFVAEAVVYPVWGSQGSGGASNILDFGLDDTVGGISMSRQLRLVMDNTGQATIVYTEGSGQSIPTGIYVILPPVDDNKFTLRFSYDGAGFLSVNINGTDYGPFEVTFTGPMRLKFLTAVTGTVDKFSYIDRVTVR